MFFQRILGNSTVCCQSVLVGLTKQTGPEERCIQPLQCILGGCGMEPGLWAGWKGGMSTPLVRTMTCESLQEQSLIVLTEKSIVRPQVSFFTKTLYNLLLDSTQTLMAR